MTIFIGGNHEASSHLFELYYGGWAAPNIYYLGAANVVWVGPLRIAGLSGIWKGYDYRKPHHERLPYSQEDIKTIYHVREWDTRKLLLLRSQVDIGLSHDWPQWIEWAGDWRKLFRDKRHFEQDARGGRLGSVAAKQVLERLRPKYWFSAHLHCKFTAVVKHGEGEKVTALASQPPTLKPPKSANGEPSGKPLAVNREEIDIDLDGLKDAGASSVKQPTNPNQISPDAQATGNNDEIDIDLDDLDDEKPFGIFQDATPPSNQKPSENQSAVSEELRAQLPEAFRREANDTNGGRVPEGLLFPKAIYNRSTNFLALDKCLPHRKFLQLSEITPISESKPSDSVRPFRFSYDKEWLAITRVFAKDFVIGDAKARVPRDQGEAHYRAHIDVEEKWVDENLVAQSRLEIPQNFRHTAPTTDFEDGAQSQQQQPVEHTNSQTSQFCSMLQIPNPFDLSLEAREKRMQRAPGLVSQANSSGGGRGGRGGHGWHPKRGHHRGRGRSRW